VIGGRIAGLVAGLTRCRARDVRTRKRFRFLCFGDAFQTTGDIGATSGGTRIRAIDRFPRGIGE
jgi:hypothetical protein